MKVLIINGPNLNMLGIREPGIYGSESYSDLCEKIKKYADEKKCETEFFQSNHEGAIIDKIHESFGKIDGIVINPGAFTHYSYAIRDAIACVKIPTVEVHISDINNREEFRKISVTAPVCKKQISGHGTDGYLYALEELINDKK